jgi:hypothetical protein
MIIILCLLLTMGLHAQNSKPSEFDQTKQKTVREMVYSKKPIIRGVPFDILTELIIPEDLLKVHKEFPKETVRLLLTIIDGGNPDDSILAAAYATASLNGPTVAPVCYRFYDRKIYDEVDEDWKMSQRQHWMKKVSKDYDKKWPK